MKIKAIRNGKTGKKQPRGYRLLGITIPFYLIALVVLFGVVSIYFAVEMASTGAVLASIESEKEILVRKNQTLKGELIAKSSLSQLGVDAEDLGFLKPQNVLYLVSEESVAKLP